jgi:hypothetical protein
MMGTFKSPATDHDLSKRHSPEAPPYSPLTPKLEAAQLPPLEEHASPAFMERPPDSVPLDLNTNTDAIALRAALSALQVQRMRAERDMQTLERQKAKAIAHPERFMRELAKGSIKSGQQPDSLVAVLQGEAEDSESDDDDDDDDDDASGDTKMGDVEDDDPAAWKEGKPFGTLPATQAVIRMPPINWAKFHVVGEPLDALHEEQRSRPDPGLPQRDAAARPPIHQLAAPYSPWKDKLPESSIRTRNSDRKT